MRDDAPSASGSAAALFDRAFSLHQAGQWEAAQGLYEQLLNVQPDHAHAVHSLGVIAHTRGRHPDAVHLFRRAIDLKGDEAVFYHSLGQSLRAQGAATEAKSMLQKAAAINPEFVGAWRALAELFYELDETEEAARAIRTVATLQSRAAEAHNQRGTALVKARRLDEACAAFREGIACNPEAAGLYYNLGNVLVAQGQFAEAALVLTHAARQAPKWADVQISLSNAHFGAGQLDAAAQAQQRALALQPQIPAGRFRMNASPLINKTLPPPSNPTSLADRNAVLTVAQAAKRATDLHGAGDLAGAERLYREILAVEPNHALALHHLGVLLYQRNEHRAALQLLDRAMSLGLSGAGLYSNRALVLAALGDLEAAERSCERALALEGAHRNARVNLELIQRLRHGAAPCSTASARHAVRQ